MKRMLAKMGQEQRPEKSNLVNMCHRLTEKFGAASCPNGDRQKGRLAVEMENTGLET